MNNESYEPSIGWLVWNKVSISGSLLDSLWQQRLHIICTDNENMNNHCHIYVKTQRRNIARRCIGFACI
jgi:hypothetical protein